MKLYSNTYEEKDFYWTECPQCNKKILIGKKGLLEIIRDVPSWIWVILLVIVAVLDFDFFREIIIEPVYKILLLIASAWVIGLTFGAIVLPIITGIVELFRK